MRIAIVTPYTLLNLGLKHLLQNTSTPLLYYTTRFPSFSITHPNNSMPIFFSPIQSSDTAIFPPSQKQNHTPRLRRVSPARNFNDFVRHTRKRRISARKIQQFIEHLDKQSEILPHELSPRETEVLRLVAKGLMNKEIADRLNISINTVLSHRKNLTAKLGIKTVSGLSFYAMMNGYISDIDDK